MDTSRFTRLAPSLAAGIDALGLTLSAEIQLKMLDYLALLSHWNKAYNLTSIDAADDMLSRHLLDSLAILPFIKGSHVLDVGTGPGLPGLILALADINRQYTLLDGNIKKTRFLTQARIELGINNIDVIHGRIEQFQPEVLFDVIVSRAFSSLPDFVKATQALLTSSGCILAMKGQRPDSEVNACKDFQDNIHIHPITVPGLDAERHLIELVFVP